ncbi:MAG: hybrid sensor histidine kinase/response regulator [Anaerolineae bacterium]|nr:hybrid sensor histidine kinase/response regulator [Anaerolineae bacterium]
MNATRPEATILLVDDDEDIRKNATLILDLEGYAVHAASNGQEALDALQSGTCRPALIVSDIAMPIMDGYAFFQAVRQIPSLRMVPFIFLSAHGSRRHVRFGRELGVDDYLVKPFDPIEFLATVRNKLNRTQEMREEVEREFEGTRRSLIQLLSHELRTPLTYITGGFELLADSFRQATDPQDVDVSLGLIRSGTQRLTRLAEQVVRYAELMSGHAQIQLDRLGESATLISLVEAAIHLAQPDLFARSIEMATDYLEAHDAEVFTVPELLSNAIYEVLRNAVYFSPEGGRVTITVTAGGETAVIAIQDHGRGILEKDQPTIWEVMQQSERTKHEQQGAGMGLPIVRQTMLLHGGSASLTSQHGVGTTVYLRMPLHKG